MKAILFVLALISLVGMHAPTTIDHLTMIVQDMGFRGGVEIAEIDPALATFHKGTIRVGTSIFEITGIEIQCILAHEVEHDKYRLVYDVPNARELYSNIEKLPAYAPSSYAGAYWERWTRWRATSETFGEMARLECLGQLANVPPEWMRAYRALNFWYANR